MVGSAEGAHRRVAYKRSATDYRGVSHRDTSIDTAAQLLTVHYQETFSLTYDFWRQRNRLFLG